MNLINKTMLIPQNTNILSPIFKHHHNLIKNFFLLKDFMRKIQSKQFLLMNNIKLPPKQFFLIYPHPLRIPTIIQKFLISIIHIQHMSLNWLNIFDLTNRFEIPLCIFVIFFITPSINLMLILILRCIKDYWPN